MTTRRTVTILVAAIVAICLGVPAAADMPPVPPPETEDVLARNLLQDDPKRPPTVTLPRGPRQAPPPTTTTTTIRPDKTITDGQRTTVTARIPTDRYQLKCHNWWELTGRCGGQYVYTDYGPCRMNEVVLSVNDDRLTVSGLRITVNTADSGLTDGTGLIEIDYFLRGTRTVRHYNRDTGTGPTETWDCALTDGIDPIRVLVRVAARPGVSRAVAEYLPSEDMRNRVAVTDFECTQDVIDEDYPCILGEHVTIVRRTEFPNPRGCVVVVTGTDVGYGNTACVTSAEAQAILDIQENVRLDENGDVVSGTPVNLNDLPRCVEGERPAAGQRCVARN